MESGYLYYMILTAWSSVLPADILLFALYCNSVCHHTVFTTSCEISSATHKPSLFLVLVAGIICVMYMQRCRPQCLLHAIQICLPASLLPFIQACLPPFLLPVQQFCLPPSSYFLQLYRFSDNSPHRNSPLGQLAPSKLAP